MIVPVVKAKETTFFWYWTSKISGGTNEVSMERNFIGKLPCYNDDDTDTGKTTIVETTDIVAVDVLLFVLLLLLFEK